MVGVSSAHALGRRAFRSPRYASRGRDHYLLILQRAMLRNADRVFGLNDYIALIAVALKEAEPRRSGDNAEIKTAGPLTLHRLEHPHSGQ